MKVNRPLDFDGEENDTWYAMDKRANRPDKFKDSAIAKEQRKMELSKQRPLHDKEFRPL